MPKPCIMKNLTIKTRVQRVNGAKWRWVLTSSYGDTLGTGYEVSKAKAQTVALAKRVEKLSMVKADIQRYKDKAAEAAKAAIKAKPNANHLFAKSKVTQCSFGTIN